MSTRKSDRDVVHFLKAPNADANTENTLVFSLKVKCQYRKSPSSGKKKGKTKKNNDRDVMSPNERVVVDEHGREIIHSVVYSGDIRWSPRGDQEELHKVIHLAFKYAIILSFCYFQS